jgi:hypothetical protein
MMQEEYLGYKRDPRVKCKFCAAKHNWDERVVGYYSIIGGKVRERNSRDGKEQAGGVQRQTKRDYGVAK